MKMSYWQGYSDALRDIQCWIDYTSKVFFQKLKINKDILKQLFDLIVRNENKFVIDKENFAIRAFIPKDKKQKIKLAHTLSEEEIKDLSIIFGNLVSNMIWKQVEEEK